MNLNEEAEEEARRKGRSARFVVQVVSRYKFTCVLTGLCCLTIDGAAIVDAAHIEPFAENLNDDIENGLALGKNAHWMFDEGLRPTRNGKIAPTLRAHPDVLETRPPPSAVSGGWWAVAKTPPLATLRPTCENKVISSSV